MNSATAKVTPKKVESIGTILVKCNNNKPTQLVKGPGKIGKNEPMIPRQTKTNPRSNKNISIVILIIIRA